MVERIRGSEIGKTGSGAKSWWIWAVCPDCGLGRYLSSSTKSEDERLAKQRCAPCHLLLGLIVPPSPPLYPLGKLIK